LNGVVDVADIAVVADVGVVVVVIGAVVVVVDIVVGAGVGGGGGADWCCYLLYIGLRLRVAAFMVYACVLCGV